MQYNWSKGKKLCKCSKYKWHIKKLKILELVFYEALSISGDDDLQIHLKRKPNAYFINSYFVEGLQAYLSKAEDETSEPMKQPAKEESVSGESNLEKMRAVVRTYSMKRECSVQEAEYLVMPELWWRKTFLKVIFLNDNIAEKHYIIFRRKEDLDKFPDDSTDAFQWNMLDRYLDRPDREFQYGKFAVIDSKCFA